jgi:hypothetical protein
LYQVRRLSSGFDCGAYFRREKMHVETMERRTICIGTIELGSLPIPLPKTHITYMYNQTSPTHTYCAESSISCFLRSFCDTGIFSSHRSLLPHVFQGARHKTQPRPEPTDRAHAMITNAQTLVLSPISLTFMPKIEEAVLIGMKINARMVTMGSQLSAWRKENPSRRMAGTHLQLRSCFLRVRPLRP